MKTDKKKNDELVHAAVKRGSWTAGSLIRNAISDAIAAVIPVVCKRCPKLTTHELAAVLEKEGIDEWQARRHIEDLVEKAPIAIGSLAQPAKKPAAKKASTKKPTAKKASAKRPAAKKASAKRPAAKKASTKKPAAKPPTSKAPRLSIFDQRVAARLTSGGCAAETIAGALGSTARKVGNSLSKLRDAGIAEQQGANWRKVPTSDDRPVEPADVLAHLRQHGPKSVGDLADALGVTHSGSVANALTKLERTNQVRRTLTLDGGLRWAAQVELIKDDPPPKARDGGRRPLADRVVELLDEKGRLTTAAIRSELGCAGSRLNSALTKLEDQGRVAMSGADGWVRVPEAAE